MRVGSENDWFAWLTLVGLSPPREASPPPPGWNLISIELPEYYGRNVVLLDCVFGLLCDPPFAGAAMCTGEFAMISGESATPMIFDRLRSCAAGRETSAEELPFTEFDSTNYHDLYGLSLIAALGRWDFWIVPSDRPYMLRFSHDGFCTAGAKSAAMIDQLSNWLKERKFGFSRAGAF
jgi:hypothetical protein